MRIKSIIMPFVVIAIMVLLPLNAFTQDNKVQNISIIVSDTTGKPLRDVAIYNSKQRVIGITDNFGTTIVSVSYGDAIVFSHISYEPKTINISDENIFDKKDNECKMIVMLREKTNMLPEAEIVENAPHLAYENKDVWIVDYVVGDEGITAITTTGRVSHLLHLSFDQDTLSVRRINTKYENLTRDVFGNIHLIGPDSTYQVYSDGEKMHILYGVTREKFDKTFAPIAVLTDSILVTKQSYYFGQEFVFFKVNRNTKKTEFMCDVFSDAKEMAKNWNIDNRRSGSMQATPMFEKHYETSEELIAIENNLIKNMMLKDIYVPVLNLDNHIYIFDFQKDAIYRFNNLGEYLDRVEISFHRGFRNSVNKNWDNHIIFDAATNECYAQFSQDGIVTLKKINLKNGSIDATYILDSHVFPTNIQVFNGEVYYQFINTRQTVGRDCRSLYKMQLK